MRRALFTKYAGILIKPNLERLNVIYISEVFMEILLLYTISTSN